MRLGWGWWGFGSGAPGTEGLIEVELGERTGEMKVVEEVRLVKVSMYLACT